MVGAAEESDVFMWMRLKTSGCDDIVAVELQGQNIYEDFLFGTIILLFLLCHIPGQPFENCFKSISFYIVWLSKWILVQGFNSLLLPFYSSHRLWFGVQTDRSAGLQGRMDVLHKYFKIASTGKGWIITPYFSSIKYAAEYEAGIKAIPLDSCLIFHFILTWIFLVFLDVDKPYSMGIMRILASDVFSVQKEHKYKTCRFFILIINNSVLEVNNIAF